MIVKKEFLKDKIEYFIYEQMDLSEYKIYECEAHELLTWNRFIIAFNLLYLDLNNKNKDLAENIYIERIRGTSLGTFTEPGFEDTKNSIEIFFKEFENTFASIKKNGFDYLKTMIPLAEDYSILNGSHRVACSIYLNLRIKGIQTKLKPIADDYKNLFDRNVPEKFLDKQFIILLIISTAVAYSDKILLSMLISYEEFADFSLLMTFIGLIYSIRILIPNKYTYIIRKKI